MIENNGYNLTRKWFDYTFENSSKVTSSHTALYLWLVEINNRLGWCKEFSITAKECMMGMSCKSYNTYKKCLDNLVEWGFVSLIKQSINQFQANVIALSKFDKAQYKALDKALVKHVTKQGESTIQSTEQSNCDIHKPINHKQVNRDFLTISDFRDKGYDFGLDEETEKSFDEFLEYRHNRKEAIRDHKVIEKQVKEMMLRSPDQKHWRRMIDFTISKTAKNIITDIDLTVIPEKSVKTQSWFNYYHEYVAYCKKEGIEPEPQMAA